MDLRENAIIGKRTRERIVSAAVCPALAGHGISLCGVSEAQRGFAFTRLRPHIAQIMACISGEGQVLVQGRLVWCTAGQAYLTPTLIPHCYHAVPGVLWRVAWIQYVEQDIRGPMLTPADAQALASAIEGLYRESVGACDGAIMLNWATLVAALGRRTIGSFHIDARLQKLWETVDVNLARNWDNDQLAGIAGVSPEHLRRLCLSQLRVTPMRHLTALRMRRADAMLRTGAYSVSAVAELAGYTDPFAFSTAFRRHFKTAPSQAIPRG